MRKPDDKIRFCSLALGRQVKDLTRVGERVPDAVTRSRVNVADRADRRTGTFVKLLRVALGARRMRWIFGYIGEGVGAGSHFVPISGREFMAR